MESPLSVSSTSLQYIESFILSKGGFPDNQGLGGLGCVVENLVVSVESINKSALSSGIRQVVSQFDSGNGHAGRLESSLVLRASSLLWSTGSDFNSRLSTIGERAEEGARNPVRAFTCLICGLAGCDVWPQR